MISKRTILIIFTLVFLAGCKKFTEDAGIPSYIHIDEIKLNAGLGEGTDSSQIADAWIYFNDELHGAYELPADIPLLSSGNQTIKIRPGVILNGISATRSIYPFFESIEKQITLIPDSIVHLNLETKYKPEAEFPWNSVGQEDFEQGGVSIDSINGSQTTLQKTTTEVYEGSFSGWIHLDQSNDYFIGATTTDYDMPSDLSALILEMNIKNPNNTVSVGIFFNSSGGTVFKEEYLFINPKDEWKKLYVNFTSLLSDYSTAKSFKIFISSSLEPGNTDADIYLDNLKLIHF